MDIEMSGFVHAKAKVRNVGDLRQLLDWCDRHSVSDDVEIDWGTGYVYVVLTGDDAVPASWIECGDHLVHDRKYDLIIDGHYCLYAHATDEPAQYDWPAKDRLKAPKGTSSMHADWRYNDLTRPE